MFAEAESAEAVSAEAESTAAEVVVSAWQSPCNPLSTGSRTRSVSKTET